MLNIVFGVVEPILNLNCNLKGGYLSVSAE